jgi:hypothetical protein
MRWRILGPALGAVLVAAVVFALWPSAAPVPVNEAPSPAALPTPSAQPVAPTRAPLVQPGAIAAANPPSTAVAPPPAPAPLEKGELDAELDPARMAALGLDPDDIEPLDGGVLHPISRDGIKSAVQEKMPEIRECYEGWLEQNPALAGRMKVEFKIVEIPGRDRARVMSVEVADGGMGHVAMEGCVRNVFKSIRFETPRGGEIRVTYPLQFESHSDTL